MEGYKMSFFKAPIWNKSPLKVVSLFWVWLTVTMKWMQLGVDPACSRCFSVEQD